MGSRTRVQSPSSVNKTSQWQLVCVFRHAHPALRCGYKRRSRVNAQQLFVSEPSLSANLQSVYKTNGVGVTGLLSSADRLTDSVLQLSSVYVESALLPCSSARKAPPPGGVIHAFRPGPVRGGYVQRACSCGALDRAPAAVAYQLPRVTGSIACSAPLQNAATREAFTGQPVTTKAVYAPVACRNSPAIYSFGVRSIRGRFLPFMSQASSIVQPTSSHVSPPFRENGDSTPRYSSWFADASGMLR